MKFAVIVVVLIAAAMVGHAWYYSGGTFALKILAAFIIGCFGGVFFLMWLMDGGLAWVKLPW